VREGWLTCFQKFYQMSKLFTGFLRNLSLMTVLEYVRTVPGGFEFYKRLNLISATRPLYRFRRSYNIDIMDKWKRPNLPIISVSFQILTNDLLNIEKQLRRPYATYMVGYGWHTVRIIMPCSRRHNTWAYYLKKKMCRPSIRPTSCIKYNV